MIYKVGIKWKVLSWLYKRNLWKPIIKNINPVIISDGSLQSFDTNYSNGDLVVLKCVSGKKRVFELRNIKQFQSFGCSMMSAKLKLTPFELNL